VLSVIFYRVSDGFMWIMIEPVARESVLVVTAFGIFCVVDAITEPASRIIRNFFANVQFTWKSGKKLSRSVKIPYFCIATGGK